MKPKKITLPRNNLPNHQLKFRDLSKLPPDLRFPKSKIIQFYSSVNNIGNYLPVLAIQKLMGVEFDTWNIHDKYIDFNFINTHYNGAIIGGAGLLYNCFENFWVRFANECKLEYVIWGVGGSYPDGEKNPCVHPNVIKSTFGRLRLVNVRDNLTANLYDFYNPHITVCPSIFYLNKFFKRQNEKRNFILYSHHHQLVDISETIKIRNTLSDFNEDYVYTDNIQTNECGFYKILELFDNSKLVITTRLHGAIIAYGLGIPYIAIARDNKLREFYNLFGNGILLEDINELHSTLESPNINIRKIQLKPVIDFGHKAKKVLNSLIK